MVKEGDLMWTPSPERVESTNLTAFLKWLKDRNGLRFESYDALWRWSVDDLEGFWGAVWDYFAIESLTSHERVLGRRRMPGAQWFPGARVNYAQHILRQERPDTDAVMFLSENTPLVGVPWPVFANQVRILATRLRGLGIRPGDRVSAYLPNIPQTLVAMLATTSIGAIWSCCSPDFGSEGVLDRFRQLAPKVLFCVDGYRYGGKSFDRRRELRHIVESLPTLGHVIQLSSENSDELALPGVLRWDALLDHPPVSADQFVFEPVPFDHPLWILFSSGTTGLPKPIVHGHGGIVLEMSKLHHLQLDLRQKDRAFFFTTTGWMMWNYLVSSLIVGACPILYDGSPAYPQVDILWKMAGECGVAFFGASPSYVEMMRKASIVPGRSYDLSRLRSIMPAGSPVSPECTAWFYENVKSDLWVATGSGGTDCCTGFVGGVPTMPVYAGEIQARSLGVAAQSFNRFGEAVTDEVGELVVTEPLPSMPVCFWNDEGDMRYHESYFEKFPGVWCHGDLFRVNKRGGCFVLGRSDATLNRHGVRIGTAEIYRALAALEEVEDALVVNLDLPGGRFFMPLFVKLAKNMELSGATDQRIRDVLRQRYTPRHVPDRIVAVPDIPYTLTGKKMELPVRKILSGMPAEQAANRSAMLNPGALDAFTDYALRQKDYSIV